MRTSDQIESVATALAKAQVEYPVVRKTKTATLGPPSAKGGKQPNSYRYADIADILQGVLPVLGRQGLALLQPTFVDRGQVWVRTRLAHSSGQWIESDYPVCSINGDHRKMGAALTYARRYALCSLLGIAADDDLDGDLTTTRLDLGQCQPRHTRGKSPAPPTVFGPTAGKPLPPDLVRPPVAGKKRLNAKTSALQRDRLISSIKNIDSTPALGEWASRHQHARDRLSTADRTTVTETVKAKKSALSSAAATQCSADSNGNDHAHNGGAILQ